MTHATPPVDSHQTETLPHDIRELAAAIEALPGKHRQAIQPLLDRVVESSKRRRRILHLVQEAISQLRLDMKYLVFDLEATRRERDDYLHRLEGPQE